MLPLLLVNVETVNCPDLRSPLEQDLLNFGFLCPFFIKIRVFLVSCQVLPKNSNLSLTCDTSDLVPSDPLKIKIYGPGTETALVNTPTQFFVDTSG